MQNTIKIRPATEKDFIGVTKLYRESFKLHHKAHPRIFNPAPQFPLSRGSFLNILEDENELMMVAEKEKVIVGFINASIEKDGRDRWQKAYHRVSIDDICVNQPERRSGIGRQLMQSIEKWAVKKGIKELTVITFNFNKIATKFYANLGYVPITTRVSKYL